MGIIKEPYRTVIQRLLDALIRLYGDNLVSLVIYGSVARGNPRMDSDIDMLAVFEELPRSIYERIRLFERGLPLYVFVVVIGSFVGPPFGRVSSVIGWVPHDPGRGAMAWMARRCMFIAPTTSLSAMNPQFPQVANLCM